MHCIPFFFPYHQCNYSCCRCTYKGNAIALSFYNLIDNNSMLCLKYSFIRDSQWIVIPQSLQVKRLVVLLPCSRNIKRFFFFKHVISIPLVLYKKKNHMYNIVYSSLFHYAKLLINVEYVILLFAYIRVRSYIDFLYMQEKILIHYL